MQRLGQLLYVIYATACGYPKGGRGMDFGLADFARATCGALSSARCVEIFDHLFTRAAGMARKRRQRVDAAPLDWAEVVEEAENLKFGQLVGQQEAEETTRRIIAETAPGGSGSGGRKSPRRDDANDEVAAGDERKRGKRGGKVEAGKAAKREAAESEKAPRGAPAPPRGGAGSATVVRSSLESTFLFPKSVFRGDARAHRVHTRCRHVTRTAPTGDARL